MFPNIIFTVALLMSFIWQSNANFCMDYPANPEFNLDQVVAGDFNSIRNFCSFGTTHFDPFLPLIPFITSFHLSAFYWVILNTDYRESSAFLYCLPFEMQGVVMATTNDFYGSQEYEERLRDFKELFQPHEFERVVHDDKCSYFKEDK